MYVLLFHYLIFIFLIFMCVLEKTQGFCNTILIQSNQVVFSHTETFKRARELAKEIPRPHLQLGQQPGTA